MGYVTHEVHEMNAYRLHTIPTSKFKTNTIIIQLNQSIQQEDVTKRALLPYVLQSGTEDLPSTKQIRSRLDGLYGATLNVDLNKKGENHIITIRMDIANEQFLSDQTPLFEQALTLLSNILLRPNQKDSAFDEQTVEKEKRTLKQRIQSVYDDKMRYANLRLIQEMCQTERYRLHVNGNSDEIDSITPKSLYQYYQKVLAEDEIDVYIVGDIDVEKVKAACHKVFQLPAERKVTEVQPSSVDVEVKEEKEVFDTQEVKQGKLHLGYRTYTTFKDDDYSALQVFNGIFGGFSHSKLFINVREKESLAYYAASRVESHKGLMLVMSGIEFANYDKTIAIIKEQLESMRAGDFTEEELNQTKIMIKNQLLETIDQPRGITELLYHQVVAKTNRSFDEMLDGIEKVTREDVIKAANKIKLDTIYFLKGKEA
ncbi:EF-P 5-aminopentanol modification-associated protein YfmF [Bacillus taeanensis]|uniref:Insulinase family protein n=1 Tax=Bacillus taeanensis TaxID=273032 RepID=A0A366XXN2_9BACI|nr:pitrilysin family protein [Bacillus taeanensis]RBW69905.1 insulinase family protein [Bacillus taeanensis]